MKTAAVVPSERVNVAVSLEMHSLRNMQRALNQFLWTTELAYGYTLINAPVAFPDTNESAVDSFSGVATEAWYPNNQGTVKFDETVGKVLEQIKLNTTQIYRAVMVFFFSHFENYLSARLSNHVNRNRGHDIKWGPYYKSLAIPALLHSCTPLRLRTVLCADISRKIRNQIVHSPLSGPLSLSDQLVKDWKTDFIRKVAQQNDWPDSSRKETVHEAFAQVIGHAVTQVKNANSTGKILPIDLFYTLFSFTNLDNLAFEIEEALIPLGYISNTTASRKRAMIRRNDLITSDQLQSKRRAMNASKAC